MSAKPVTAVPLDSRAVPATVVGSTANRIYIPAFNITPGFAGPALVARFALPGANYKLVYPVAVARSAIISGSVIAWTPCVAFDSSGTIKRYALWAGSVWDAYDKSPVLSGAVLEIWLNRGRTNALNSSQLVLQTSDLNAEFFAPEYTSYPYPYTGDGSVNSYFTDPIPLSHSP